MSIYGILHIPTGSLVHVVFASGEHYESGSFEADVTSEYLANADTWTRICGFYISPLELVSDLYYILLASHNKDLLCRLIWRKLVRGHIAQDLYNDYDLDCDLDNKKNPSINEFEVIELDSNSNIEPIEEVYMRT